MGELNTGLEIHARANVLLQCSSKASPYPLKVAAVQQISVLGRHWMQMQMMIHISVKEILKLCIMPS